MGEVAQTVLDRSLRQAVGLARFENGLVRETIRLLDEADVELEGRISRAIGEKRAPETVRRLKDLRAELRSVNAEAYRLAGKHLKGELAEFGARLGPATAELLDGSVAPLAFSFTRPSAQLLRSIITSEPFQGELIGPHIDKLAGNRLAALVRETQQGLLQGQSNEEILVRIRGRKVRGKFRGGVLDQHRVGRPALENLVRTATQHVQTTAQQRTLEENSDLVRGVMWAAALDHRVCRVCQVRDGKVWEFDPETGAYAPTGHSLPWLGGPGRAHFGDRCVPIAWLRDLSVFEDAGIDISPLTQGERAAFQNPVPVTEDYESWLRKQPREIQALALNSKRRAAAFRRGETLSEVWTRAFNVRAVRPAPLSAVLPAKPTPLTKAEVKAELAALERARLDKNAELIDQKTDLREAYEARRKELVVLMKADPFEGPKIQRLEAIELELDATPTPRGAGRSAVAARNKTLRLRNERNELEDSLDRSLVARDPSLKVIERRMSALRSEQDRLLETFAGRARELFTRNKPSSGFKTRWHHDFDDREEGEQAMRWLAHAWTRDVKGRGVSYNWQPPGTRASYELGVVKITEEHRAPIYAHELGHWLEDIDKEVHRRILRFYDRRTRGEPLEPMGEGHARFEVTRPDKFLDRYMGRDYDRRATEILSMGLELLYANPWRLLEDEDYFDFILDILGHR